MIHKPQHTPKKTPESWPGLLKQTRELSQQSQHPQLNREAALAIHSSLDWLSDQELEETRYYGLGEIACGLAIELQNPEFQSEIIQWATHGIVSRAQSHAQRSMLPLAPNAGMYRSQLDSDYILPETEFLLHRQLRNTPRELQQLTDVLHAAVLGRREHHIAGVRCIDKPDANGKVINGAGSAIESLNVNLFGGAMELYASLVTLHLPEPERGTSDCLIRDVIEIEKITTTSLGAAALKAARLHIDEVQTQGFTRYLSLTSQGTLQFNQQVLRSKPARIPKATINLNDIDTVKLLLASKRALHDHRIGCPALYVRGLIPQATTLLGEVIQRADHQLQQLPPQHNTSTPATQLAQFIEEYINL